MCGREFLLRQASAYPLKRKNLKIFYYVYSGTRGRYEGKFGIFYYQEKAWEKLYKCGVNWQASQLL